MKAPCPSGTWFNSIKAYSVHLLGSCVQLQCWRQAHWHNPPVFFLRGHPSEWKCAALFSVFSNICPHSEIRDYSTCLAAFPKHVMQCHIQRDAVPTRIPLPEFLCSCSPLSLLTPTKTSTEKQAFTVCFFSALSKTVYLFPKHKPAGFPLCFCGLRNRNSFKLGKLPRKLTWEKPLQNQSQLLCPGVWTPSCPFNCEILKELWAHLSRMGWMWNHRG